MQQVASRLLAFRHHIFNAQNTMILKSKAKLTRLNKKTSDRKGGIYKVVAYVEINVLNIFRAMLQSDQVNLFLV